MTDKCGERDRLRVELQRAIHHGQELENAKRTASTNDGHLAELNRETAKATEAIERFKAAFNVHTALHGCSTLRIGGRTRTASASGE
jgi:hypothetical protein